MSIVDAERRAFLLNEARIRRVKWLRDADHAQSLDLERTSNLLLAAFPSAWKLYAALGEMGGAVPAVPDVKPGAKNEAESLAQTLLPFAESEQNSGAQDDTDFTIDELDAASPVNLLLRRLHAPAAAECVSAMEQFAAGFSDRVNKLLLARSQGPVDLTAECASQADIVRRFLHRTAQQLRSLPPWLSDADADWALAQEALERLLLCKMYSAAAALSEDRPKDAALAVRLEQLAFLTPEQLGCPAEIQDMPLWAAATTHLARIDAGRCPAEKLDCVTQCTRNLAQLLTLQDSARDGGVSLPGADELLPLLIQAVRDARPARVHSNLAYLRAFGAPERVANGEGGYALTQLEAAVHFLMIVDAATLAVAMTPEEFAAGMRRSGECEVDEHVADTAAANVESQQQSQPQQSSNLQQTHNNTAARPLLPLSVSEVARMRRSGDVFQALCQHLQCTSVERPWLLGCENKPDGADTAAASTGRQS